jgi:hypothetical protein
MTTDSNYETWMSCAPRSIVSFAVNGKSYTVIQTSRKEDINRVVYGYRVDKKNTWLANYLPKTPTVEGIREEMKEMLRERVVSSAIKIKGDEFRSEVRQRLTNIEEMLRKLTEPTTLISDRVFRAPSIPMPSIITSSGTDMRHPESGEVSL